MLDESGKPDPLMRSFDPSCTHERTSYDIMHCPACAAYTERRWAEYWSRKPGNSDKS